MKGTLPVTAGALATRHWFYLLVPVWLAASWELRSSHPWTTQPALGEAIILFDWCVFVPATFALCYRGMPHRALATRVLAMMCGGIWLSGRLVPPDAQAILDNLVGIRWIGIPTLILLEVIATMAMLRVVFGAAPDTAALQRHGVPPIVARLMITEARFWRRVWVWLTGR